MVSRCASCSELSEMGCADHDGWGSSSGSLGYSLSIGIICLLLIIWLLHNLVEASFDLFRYLLRGDQLKPLGTTSTGIIKVADCLRTGLECAGSSNGSAWPSRTSRSSSRCRDLCTQSTDIYFNDYTITQPCSFHCNWHIRALQAVHTEVRILASWLFVCSQIWE